MEELKLIIIEKWPEILSYVLNLIAYFLFLLYRAKFTKTKNSMSLLFKDKVKQVSAIDTNMRTDMERERAAMRAEFSATQEEYKKSKKEYEEYLVKLHKMGRALAELLKEKEGKKNGTDTECKNRPVD